MFFRIGRRKFINNYDKYFKLERVFGVIFVLNGSYKWGDSGRKSYNNNKIFYVF